MDKLPFSDLPRATLPFLDLPRLHDSIRGDLDQAFARVLRTSAFVEGPELERFEQAFAEAHGLPAAAGVGSGTDALALALRALGIGTGDEVVVPSMTFIATAEAVIHAGATPVIADVDADTLLLNSSTLEPVLSGRTRAVIPVHLFGHVVAPAEMRRWREGGLIVLEDAAQAHLGHRDGVGVGHTGNAACFSFYPGKNLGALGDGGAVGSRDLAVVDEVRRLRNHGSITKYEHQVAGYCSRLDGLQAALLAVKLARLPLWTEARRKLAERYRQILRPHGVRLVPWHEGDVHHLIAIRVGSGARDEVRQALAEDSVETGIHYPIPLSEQPAMAPCHRPCPNAELAARELLSLPMDPLMTFDDVDRVCELVARLHTS
jgi:dTDP-4-amino-4,6-dideoxygalactose transaminase